jgi:hypothetical protein
VAERKPRPRFTYRRIMVQVTADTDAIVTALCERWQCSQSMAINLVLRAYGSEMLGDISPTPVKGELG